ncbi:hypothetical protein OHC33_007217 [Knufia fluminis]|uniref:Major facilitator superfamily (MFS) profile domain-containing protein n=1 Tax=Knufia fluminis TaxID=191047 RepID=A0AAN8EC10_9EURO|nr:hypothetical protein OHC33_007217 [Knufia fluminis]
MTSNSDHEMRAEEPKPSPPPNGGLTAYSQVLADFFLFFNSWGLANTFGVFQSYYSTSLLPEAGQSTISWIGSLATFLIAASPIVWGPVFDQGHPRLLLILGTFLVVLRLMMTSLCTQFWQFILAQGICVGLGGGCLFLTAVAIVPSYFTTKRAIAVGGGAVGSSIGGVIYPIVFHELQPRIGFGWAVRVIGFIALATLIVPCALIKLRIPFFYIELYAAAHGVRPEISFYMLPIMSAGSAFGRVVPPVIADKADRTLLVLSTCTGLAGILSLCWIAIKESVAGLIVFSVLYGFFSGAIVSLQTPSVAKLTTDFSKIGTKFGINAFFSALGVLIGSPSAGAIERMSWSGMQAFAGAALVLSAALTLLTRVVNDRKQSHSEKVLEST